jgi:hypothetical protein
MAIDPKLLSRLQKVFERLADPDPGSRAGALSGLFEMCAREGIDLRDLKIHTGDRMDGWDAWERLQKITDNLRESWETTDAANAAQIKKLRAEIEALKKAKSGRRTKALNDALTQLREAREEITKLKAASANDADHAYQARIAELDNKLTAERTKTDDMDHAYQARIAELEAGLVAAAEITRDPWYERVAQWLAARPNEYRHPTVVILQAALGIDTSQQDVEAGRRLAKVMAGIGGWKPSTNIPHGSTRARGYIRPRYT